MNHLLKKKKKKKKTASCKGLLPIHPCSKTAKHFFLFSVF